MIQLKTNANCQYMAYSKSAMNLKKIVYEYNKLRDSGVKASIKIDDITLEEFEMEEFFDGRLSSLEFYDDLIKSVEDWTLFQIRAEHRKITEQSNQDKNNGWDDGFEGFEMEESEKDNWFYCEGYRDGEECRTMCERLTEVYSG